MASTAARPGSCCAPATAKKIFVDSTSKLPASTIGLPKSARLSTKPSRNALASAGRKQRPGHGAEHAAARRAQRLRGFLERGADRRQRAVQDHERDRRERQQLRERHARQSVDPARARDAEQRVEPAGDEAGASEQHDERQRDHERRRDDRQDRHQLQHARVALAAALHDQREHEAEQRRQHADDRRRACAELIATPQRVPPPRQPRPQMSAVNRRSRGELRARRVPCASRTAASSDVADRVEDEERRAARRSRRRSSRPSGSPPNTPRRAMRARETHGQRGERQRRADAERRAGRSRRRSPAPNAHATASAGGNRGHAVAPELPRHERARASGRGG